MVLCEKESLKDQVVKLNGEVKRLNDRVGVLTVGNTDLSKRMADLEADLVGEGAVRRVLEKDILWILHDGLSQVVDRVIESLEFLQGLIHVQAACVAAGVEQVKELQKNWWLSGNLTQRWR